MKSNSLVMATLLLGIGIGIGYSLGRWQGNATGETARISTGNQQQTSGKPTAGSDGSTKHKRSANNGEAPSATAKRLLDAMFQNNLGNAEDPVGRIQFQKALSECDEATLSALLEDMLQFFYKWDHSRFFFGNSEAVEWCHLMVERMAALEPMKALDAILSFGQTLPSMEKHLELIFANLNQQDPSQIASAIAKMEAKGRKREGRRACMRTQAKTDPQAVFRYLMEWEDKPNMESNADFEAIAMRLGLYAPEKAVAAISQHEMLELADGCLAQIMQGWFKRDPSAASAYAMAQKDASLLVHCLEGPFSNEDFSALRQAFPEWKSSNSMDYQTLASRLAENLAQQDVNAARQWVATLPTAEQAKANSAIANKWIDKDPVAASEWLATWPAGEDKELSASILIDKIQKDDPERALTWATNTLQGPNRYNCLSRIMESLPPSQRKTARC